jgi:subtilisin family serine protease
VSFRAAPLGQRALFAVVFVALAAGALSGCLGIERTEWAFQVTQIDRLQEDGLTGAGVTVAIVDTGIDLEHPALRHVTVVAWRDYVNERPDPYDDSGHGTHIAGIIAARASFGQWLSGGRVTGVAPEVQLVVVKVCGAEECSGNAVRRGIEFATAQGADILVLSLGGRQVLPLDLGSGPAQAVEDATRRGVYVVAAAGNAGTEHGDVESPGSARNAIAVGAVDKDLRVADFSSRGSESTNQGVMGTGVVGRADPHKKPEIVAPGVEILSTWTDGAFARASGTSQSAPFVAGVLALLLEAHPQWRRSGERGGGESAVVAMKDVLMRSAEPLQGQRTPHDNASGYGLIQALDAERRLAAL